MCLVVSGEVVGYTCISQVVPAMRDLTSRSTIYVHLHAARAAQDSDLMQIVRAMRGALWNDERLGKVTEEEG